MTNRTMMVTEDKQVLRMCFEDGKALTHTDYWKGKTNVKLRLRIPERIFGDKR